MSPITSKPSEHSGPPRYRHSLSLTYVFVLLPPTFLLLTLQTRFFSLSFPSDPHPILSRVDIIPPLGVTRLRDPLSWLPDSWQVYWVRHIECGLCWTLVKPFETYGRNTLGWTLVSSHGQPLNRSLLTHVPVFLCLNNP